MMGKEFWIATGKRAVRTFAQGMLAPSAPPGSA